MTGTATGADPSGGYDRLAGHYRRLERLAFGTDLMRARLAQLPALDRAGRVLIVGEGDGRFLAALCRRNRHCRVVCLERSGAMIALARRRLGSDAGRVRFLQSDVRTVDLGAEPFDGLVTHFVLDLFEPATLERLIPRLAAALVPGGVWLIADFALPPTGIRRWRARAWLALLYALFRGCTDLEAQRLPDPGDALRAAGLRREAGVALQARLLTSDRWRLEGRRADSGPRSRATESKSTS